MFAVCLVHLVLVQSQAITCTSNQPDTDCTASNNCRDEHPPEGTRYEQYIDDTCDPGFSSRTYSMPVELESQLCTFYPLDCDVAADNEESTRYEGKPEVNVKLETASLYRFDVHISWEHNPNTSREIRSGYQVQVRNEKQVVDCFCVNDRNARSLTVTGSTYIRFGNRENLIVEVVPYPLPNIKDFVDRITGNYSSKWPSSCLDLGKHNCYPPTYPPPSNIQLHTYSESMQSMRLDVMWDAVMPYSSWNNTEEKFTYYLQLMQHEPNLGGNINIRSKYDYFRVKNSGNTSRIIVSLFPLNISVNYTYIYLLTHYPCSGLATVQTINIGCGDLSTRYSILPLPSATVQPVSSILLLSPPTAFMGSTGLTLVGTVLIAVIPTLCCIAIFVVGIVSAVCLCHKRSVSGSHINRSNEATNDIELFTISESNTNPLLDIPTYRVFVFYSLESQNEERILYNVVQKLGSVRGIEVSYPGQLCRDSIPQWIEEAVQEAVAVFIVCDETFSKGWESKTSPYVNTLKLLIEAKVMASDVNKFAVVVFDNEDQYIPSDFLRSFTKFNVRESYDDYIVPMVHFAMETSPYELHHVPDSIAVHL